MYMPRYTKENRAQKIRVTDAIMDYTAWFLFDGKIKKNKS